MNSKYTWILDPGHGGLGPRGEYLTPGKRSPSVPPGIYEGEFNRDICRRVAELCDNYVTTITNPGPANMGLRARTKYARALHRERGNCIFMSIHANAAKGNGWVPTNGAVVFHHPRDIQGKALAEWLLDAVDAYTLLNTTRGVKTARFSVLSGTRAMPSVLIECGFMTDKIDAIYLATESGRDDVARAIYETISTYEKGELI
jgi:N-acetylmuramoyl-L-alanine amidase